MKRMPEGGQRGSTGVVDEQTRRVLTSPKALWTLARASVAAWIDDFAPSMGAALSYYTVFSIAPLLLIVIAVVGFVYGHDAASGRIFEELRGLVGEEGATAIQGLVKSASDRGKGVVATVVGVVTLVIGATTVFGELQSALDRIWRSPAVAKKEGLWNLVRARVLSFGLIVAVGFLLLVSLVVSAGISAISALWGTWFHGFEVLLQITNFVVSLAIITVLFALTYKLLPRARIGWRDVWIGAGVTALLFSIGKFLIGLYIGKSSIVSGFGAAGSLVVVLLWVYYSAQIFLLGAEFTWVYSYRYGSHRRDALPTPAVDSRASPEANPKALPEPEDAGRPDRTEGAVRFRARKVPATERLERSLDAHPGWVLALAVGLAAAATFAAAVERRR